MIYIDCKSPITPDRRPIIALNTTVVNRDSISTAIPLIVKEIQGIAEYHTGESGVIHCTYQLSNMLRNELDGDRYIFHNRENKKEMYQLFRDTPGSILVACGMYEGIDLPEDLGRWQVIAKIPWPSLGNPAIKHLSDLDPDWYLWETIKTTVQAAGRICRTPDDYGVTYILDTSFWRMFNDGRYMIPEYFSEALNE